MRPAGLREVQRARADGRWAAAYDPPSTATVPDDLADALAHNEKAAAFFATLDSRNRFAILHRIADAKKPETRARRIAKFVDMLARREKLY
ncbi:MAG: YdeI/OmpD-associated family protein [Sciscionella sp.]|nr:YdeI/OmpD-associated family protein [Sciscionella sp.]